MKVGQFVRQGDVIVTKVDDSVEGLERVKPDTSKGFARTVLAYGEVSGHAHAFNESDKVEMYRDASNDHVYLRVLEPTAFTHEEHFGFKFAPGVYKVDIQREYTPKGIVRVVD